MISAIIILLASNFTVLSSNPLDSASVAYKEGRYEDAVEIYKRVAKTHGESASLLANLGNIYLKAGDYGNAMLSYERSLRLNPSNKSVRNNRLYILSKVEDGNKANAKGKNVSVVAEETTFIYSLNNYITREHSSTMWAIWGGICFVIVCLCIALYMFRTEVLLRKIGFFGSIVMLVASITLICFSLASAKAFTTHDEGVVTGYKVTLLSEPYSTANASCTPLVSGTKLDILEREEGANGSTNWYKVRLNSDFVGWIQSSDFEEI